MARIIATDPRALDLLIEAGFTPLATPALRAALANTVSLRQAIRLRGLSDGAAEALIGALLDLAPLTELIDASR